MNRNLIRLIGIISLAILVIIGATGLWIWHRVSLFREDLATALGNKLHAFVEIGSFEVDFWQQELHAAAITLKNQVPDAPWESAEISTAKAQFKWSDLLAKSIPIHVEVSSWSLILKSNPIISVQAGGADSSTESTTRETSAEPSKFMVTQIKANEGAIKIHLSGQKQIDIAEVNLESDRNSAGLWTTKFSAKSLNSDPFQSGPVQAIFRSDDEKFTMENLLIQCESGKITGDGTLSLAGPSQMDLHLKADLVPMATVISSPWRVKVTGYANGNLHYTNQNNTAVATGHIDVVHGKFNLLPQLATLTTLLGISDFSNLELDQSSSDFNWKDGTLHLSHLILIKDNIARIIGEAQIDPTSQVDAKLKLGLPAPLIDKWPKLKDKVFSVNLENYDWTEVHVTGTPDHLQEDLTARIAAVGAEDAGSLVNQAVKNGSDLIKGFFQ